MPQPVTDALSIRDNRQGSWFWVDNTIIKEYARLIKPLGVSVYCALAMHADNSGKSWPSYKTLGKELGMSKRHIIRGIGLLEEHGLISITRQEGRGNVYALNAVEKPVTPAHPPHQTGDTRAPTGDIPSQDEQDPLTINNTAVEKTQLQNTKPLPVLTTQGLFDEPKQTTRERQGPGYQKALQAAEVLRRRRIMASSPHS